MALTLLKYTMFCKNTRVKMSGIVHGASGPNLSSKKDRKIKEKVASGRNGDINSVLKILERQWRHQKLFLLVHTG